MSGLVLSVVCSSWLVFLRDAFSGHALSTLLEAALMVMDVRGVVVVGGAGPTQQVGLLNNGSAVTAVDGAVSYTFLEEVAKLRGVNTILGRSFVIHGDGTATGTLVRVGQCVIGRMAEIGVPGICCVVLWARGAKGRASAVAFYRTGDCVCVACLCL